MFNMLLVVNWTHDLLGPWFGKGHEIYSYKVIMLLLKLHIISLNVKY
jgi:hypothetical protein